jgi:DNA mismatch repair protein MutS2
MTPTFRLAVGVPGSSSALAVARRFGIPGTVVERAERFLTREERSFEVVVKNLNDERAALELARSAAEQREHEAHATLIRLDVELAAAKNRERRALSDEARELVDRLRRARDDLRAAQAKLRTKRIDPQALREAERAIERVAGEVALGGALEPLVVGVDEPSRVPVNVASLRKGMRVWVARLRAEAEVIEVLPGEQVRIAAGPLKLKVPAGELRSSLPVEETSTRAPARGARSLSRESVADVRSLPSQRSGALPTSECTCDLRGLRIDDAMAMAVSFVDRALNEGHRAVFFIHGHGTGELREALRKEFMRSAHVAHVGSAEPQHGGEAVTVVWLA